MKLNHSNVFLELFLFSSCLKLLDLLHEVMVLYVHGLFNVFCILDICRVIELLDRLQRSGELPPPKLQALQRVLQSKFCTAIREV